MPKKKGGKGTKGPDPNNPFDMVVAQPEQVQESVRKCTSSPGRSVWS